MPDLTPVLEKNIAGTEEISFRELPAWREIEKNFLVGKIPHCWAIRAPAGWHGEILKAMSHLYLCDNGKGNDGCPGCRAWSATEEKGETHPDLTMAGTFEKAAGIDACRALIQELPLKPVTAKRRLGVLPSAEKLLPAAANSLLKITEEPPSHACILFIMEGDDFLPTLRSRSRFTVLTAPFSLSAKPAPDNDVEWLAWLEKMKMEGAKEDEPDISELLSNWVSYAMQTESNGKSNGENNRENNGLMKAARMEKLRLLVEQKKLSRNMICDLLILTLREALPFEYISGDIW
ncbi:MAG: hypothetical protein LBR61_08590 [Synergistaceae bacterium]|jgi:DNA polymerase-3 subunit delta'|nr:hypothetical protein [Synergistaceae bacterium]